MSTIEDFVYNVTELRVDDVTVLETLVDVAELMVDDESVLVELVIVEDVYVDVVMVLVMLVDVTVLSVDEVTVLVVLVAVLDVVVLVADVVVPVVEVPVDDVVRPRLARPERVGGAVRIPGAHLGAPVGLALPQELRCAPRRLAPGVKVGREHHVHLGNVHAERVLLRDPPRRTRAQAARSCARIVIVLRRSRARDAPHARRRRARRRRRPQHRCGR